MKRALIVTLVCVNLALLATLILGTGVGSAKAQVMGSNYIMVPANINSDYQAVYVIDLASRKMVAFRMDRTSQKLVPIRGLQLLRDFGRRNND